MKHFISLFCFLAFVLFGSSALANDTDIAETMQKTYAGITDFRADIEQELLQKDAPQPEKRNGRFSFQKPFLVRWETAAPHAELLMVTKEEIWDYFPDEDFAYRYSLDKLANSSSLVQVLTGQSSLRKNFDLEDAHTPEDGDLIHLLLLPKQASTDLTEAQIWVRRDTAMLQRIVVMDFYGNTNTITLKNYKINAKISPEEFFFTPSKGVQVEDHTGDVKR